MGFASNLANLIGADPAMPVQANSREHESARARRPARILVVDDEAPVRSMIGATLQRQGYEVQLAISGAQISSIAVRTPDISSSTARPQYGT